MREWWVSQFVPEWWGTPPTNSVFVDVDDLEIVVDLEQMTAHDVS